MSTQETARLIDYAFLLFPLMLALFFVGNVLYLRRIREILAYIAQHHPAAWDALGKITLFNNNSPGNSRKLLKFLYRREFRQLGDEVLAKKCESTRSMLLRLAIAEGCFAALFLILCLADSILKRQ